MRSADPRSLLDRKPPPAFRYGLVSVVRRDGQPTPTVREWELANAVADVLEWRVLRCFDS